MSSFDDIKKLRFRIYQETIRRLDKYLRLVRDGTSLLIDASEILESEEKSADHRTAEGASKTAAWRFLSTLPTSSFWCCEIAMSGDYGIAKNILRLTLEELVKLAYYVTFPDKALRRVAQDRDSDEVNLADMLHQMDFKQRDGLMRLHGELSAFYSHANLNLPQELVFHELDNSIRIGGGPRFSPNIFEPIIQQLLIIIFLMGLVAISLAVSRRLQRLPVILAGSGINHRVPVIL